MKTSAKQTNGIPLRKLVMCVSIHLCKSLAKTNIILHQDKCEKNINETTIPNDKTK